MKEIRLKKLVKPITFSYIIKLYKEVKQTHDAKKILLFKSFIKRMVDAQDEMILDGEGKIIHSWATIDEYFEEVVIHKHNYLGISGLDFILKITQRKDHHPFGYDMKKDIRKTL